MSPRESFAKAAADAQARAAQTTSTGTTSLDAAMLAAWFDYHDRLRHDPCEREVHGAGFRAGARYAVRTMTVLADPELRKALAVLCELFGESEG